MIRQCHLSGRSWQESYRQGSHSSPRSPSLGSHALVSMTTCKPLATLATSQWEMSAREWLWKLAFDTPCSTALPPSVQPLWGASEQPQPHTFFFFSFHIQAHTNTKGRHIARRCHKHTSPGLTVSILLCLSYTILNINLTATLPIQQRRRREKHQHGRHP